MKKNLNHFWMHWLLGNRGGISLMTASLLLALVVIAFIKIVVLN